MPRRPLTHERIRTEVTEAGTLVETPEDFGRAVLGVLHHAIGYDDARMFGVDPGTLLLNRLIAATEPDGPFRGHWLRHIYLAGADDGYFAPHELMGSGAESLTYHSDQTRCWGLPESLRGRFSEHAHTSYFHETRTPVGGSMRLCLRARGAWIGMLDIVRRDSGTPLTATDYTLLKDLGRLIGQGLDAALLREAARRPNGLRPDGPGVIVISGEHRITYQTPDADRWMATLYDTDVTLQGDLPTPLWSIVAAARHGDVSKRPAVMMAPSTAGPLRIEATEGQEPGSIAIVISPVRRATTVSLPDQWQLTERQRAIVEQLLRGSSTKEIARALFISVPTVETHLGHIYGRLDISGRHELLACYFQHAILPNIDADGVPQR